MPIAVQCSKCERRFRAPDSAAGKIATCPNCGSKFSIPPPESPPIITVSPEHIAAATKDSGSNAPIIIGSVATVVVALGVVVWLVLSDAASEQAQVGTDQVVQAEADSLEPDQIEPIASEEIEAEPLKPGFGVTLAQFKKDVPIGESWKVLSETTHENGRVVYQLLSTTMKSVMLMVAGNPDDLGEVSFTFSVTTDMDDGDSLSRFAVMMYFLAKYSNWTEEELGQFWQRLLQVGAGEETDFKIQKNGHTFWMTPMGVQSGTFFMTGVSVDQESKAPTLQQWLASHPVPVGAGLYKSSDRSGNVGNAKFSFKSFRHKGDGNFIGEMTNESNQDLQIATFTLSIYDRNAELLDTGPIVINSFRAGQTKSFDVYIDDVPGQFFYKIDFENAFDSGLRTNIMETNLLCESHDCSTRRKKQEGHCAFPGKVHCLLCCARFSMLLIQTLTSFQT